MWTLYQSAQLLLVVGGDLGIKKEIDFHNLSTKKFLAALFCRTNQVWYGWMNTFYIEIS